MCCMLYVIGCEVEFKPSSWRETFLKLNSNPQTEYNIDDEINIGCSTTTQRRIDLEIFFNMSLSGVMVKNFNNFLIYSCDHSSVWWNRHFP